MLLVGRQPLPAGRCIVPDGPCADWQARHAGAAQALNLAGADPQVGGKLFGGDHVSPACSAVELTLWPSKPPSSVGQNCSLLLSEAYKAGNIACGGSGFGGYDDLLRGKRIPKHQCVKCLACS